MEDRNMAHSLDSEEQKEAEELYEKFLDSSFVRERREILQKLRGKGYLTEKMLHDFAVVMDLSITGKDLDDYYYDLLTCMDSLARFETTGLR